MAPRNPPVWLQAGDYSAESDRTALAGLIDPTFTGAGADSALIGGTFPPYEKMRVKATTGTNMQITITSGMAAVAPITTDPPGVYIVVNEGNTTLSLTPAGTLRRRDLIVARVYDVQQGDASDEWAIEVIEGIPAASPATPATPTGAVALASVLVKPASETGGTNRVVDGDITDLRYMVAGVGGVHLYWSGMQSPQASPGRLRYNVSTDVLEQYSGASASWVRVRTDTIVAADRVTYAPKQVETPSCRWSSATMTTQPLPYPTGTTPLAATKITAIKTPTGSLWVNTKVLGRVTGGVGTGWFGYQIRPTGSATVVVEHSSARGALFYDERWTQASTRTLVSGLTPDLSYELDVTFQRTNSSDEAQFLYGIVSVEAVV